MSLLLLFGGAAEEAPSPRVVIGPGQGRQHQNGFITLGSSLLLTVLATASMPFVNDTASYAASLQRPQQNTILLPGRGVNAQAPASTVLAGKFSGPDGSQARPAVTDIPAHRALTLYGAAADALPAGGRTPTLQVQRKLNLNDTTTRNLNTGTLDFQSIASAMCEWPRNVEPKRLLSDTSAGMPEALRAVVAAAPPFFSTPFSSVQLPRFTPAEVRSGLNASLSPNDTRAIGQASFPRTADPKRIVSSTEQASPRMLLEASAPPVVLPFRVESVQQPRRLALLSETSYGTPKALIPDVAVPPILQNQFTGAPQYRQVYFDSDQGLPKALRANVDPLPIGLNPPFYSVQRRVIPNDTTISGRNTWTLSAPANVSMSFYHPLDNAGVLTGGSSVTFGACLTLSSGFPGTDVYPVSGTGYLTTGDSGGTVTLQFRAEVAGVVTAKSGMTLIIDKV